MLKRVIGYLKERVAVLVEFGTRSRIRGFSVPRWIICLGCGITLLILAGSLYNIGTEGFTAYNRARLERENAELHARFRDLSAISDSLEELIRLAEVHDIQMRILNEMDVLPEDVRKLGVGGSDLLSTEMIGLRELDSGSFSEIAVISRGVDELLRRTHYQKESFSEIEVGLEKNAEIRDHIPSVVPTKGTFCGKFGYRSDPILGIRKMHCGVDISNLRGTPVIATADGVVSYTGWISGYGNVIKIEHGNCIETVYAHLSEIFVEVGDEVERYSLIGAMGATGRTVGTHLHYEVRVAGKAVNPEGYFLNGEEVLTQYPMP
ncbi:peptidoglycan DD-metalloendopeptidase family protein [candidate division WOR-3 bacterium]|uniref:Peptidoglycan DD-metalloendopeptidase family protein n=1 Tax=candidate division WOR-3 bacterium TaxID=2052148 RepID=A0A9D5K7Q4_UNCW3|nr:peptidoglycan DD-metalloendopeptidase family protein [candidate division WOR-3 bacterium]MBD3363818.1 peptidoglycan DD-metalloendopeptidase family protein [candidate division WOR-3 bacterium]